VQRLHEAFRRAMDDSEFPAVMTKFDMGIFYLNAEDYKMFMPEDCEKIGRLVKIMGLDEK
jgi:tripartite-type tricarboxylate transporter receptor subunit TctC